MTSGALYQETSIRVYHLDRTELKDARHATQKLAWLALSAKLNAGDFAGALALRQTYRDGTEPYSLAVEDYLRLKHDEWGRALFGPP